MGSEGREGKAGRGTAALVVTVVPTGAAPTRELAVVSAAAVDGAPGHRRAAAGGARGRWLSATCGGTRRRLWGAPPSAGMGGELPPRGRARPARRHAAAAMGLAAITATVAAAATVVVFTLAAGGAAAAGGGGGGGGRTPRNGVTPWVWEHPLTGGVVSTTVTGCHVGRDGSLLVVGTATTAAGRVSATVTKLATATGAVLDTATLPGSGGTPTTVVASAYDADADLLLLTGLASGGVPPPPPVSGTPGGAPTHVTTADGGGGADVYVAAWSTLPPAAAASPPAAHLVRRFTTTLGGAGDDVPFGVAALGGGRYAVVGSARRAVGAGPPDGLLVSVLSSAGRVVTSAVTRLGGGAGYMAAVRAVAVSPADGTILVAYEEAELPAQGGAAAAAADAPASAAVIVGGGGGTAVGGGASQRFSVALFSATTASLVRAPSPLSYRFSPFTPAAAVEPVTAAYSPAVGAYYVVCRNVALSNTRLPPPVYSTNSGVSYTLATLPAAAPAVEGGGTAVGGGDALATRLLTVSFPDPATRAGAAELSPAATAFLDVASSASTIQLALAVSSSVVAATLTTIRYDYGLTAGSRATLSAGGRPGGAAIFRGAAAPSARLPTFAYGAVHAASAAAPSSAATTNSASTPPAAGAPPPSCDDVRSSAAGVANATAVLWPPLGAAAAGGSGGAAAGAPAARWVLSFGTRTCAEAVAGGVPSAGGTAVYLVGVSGGSLDGAAAAVGGEEGGVAAQAARGATRAWAVAVDAATGALPRLTPACGVACVEAAPTAAPSAVPRPARTPTAAAAVTPGGGEGVEGGGPASGNVTAEATVGGGGDSDSDSDSDGGGVLWGLSLPVVAAIGAASLVAVCLLVAVVAYVVRTTR